MQGYRQVFSVVTAAHLKTVLVLHDHLAHSDPDRLVWFRDRLRPALTPTPLPSVQGRGSVPLTVRLPWLRRNAAPLHCQIRSQDGLLTVMDLKRLVSIWQCGVSARLHVRFTE